MAPGLLKRFQLWSWPRVAGIRWLPWLCLRVEKACSCSVLALELADWLGQALVSPHTLKVSSG